MPNLEKRMFDLLVRLEDAVEALDGVSVEDEAIVDEYRAVMKEMGVVPISSFVEILTPAVQAKLIQCESTRLALPIVYSKMI